MSRCRFVFRSVFSAFQFVLLSFSVFISFRSPFAPLLFRSLARLSVPLPAAPGRSGAVLIVLVALCPALRRSGAVLIVLVALRASCPALRRSGAALIVLVALCPALGPFRVSWAFRSRPAARPLVAALPVTVCRIRASCAPDLLRVLGDLSAGRVPLRAFQRVRKTGSAVYKKKRPPGLSGGLLL